MSRNAYTFQVPVSGRISFSMPEVVKLTGIPREELDRQIKAGTFHTHLVGKHHIATFSAIAKLVGSTRQELVNQDPRPMAFVTIGKAAA